MSLAATASPTRSLVPCSLCELTTLHPLVNEAGDVFCCPSCREVAALLAENPPASEASAAPAQVGERGGVLSVSKGEVVLTLGGMWCPSCAWLVSEQIKHTKGVASAF